MDKMCPSSWHVSLFDYVSKFSPSPLWLFQTLNRWGKVRAFTCTYIDFLARSFVRSRRQMLVRSESRSLIERQPSSGVWNEVDWVISLMLCASHCVGYTKGRVLHFLPSVSFLPTLFFPAWHTLAGEKSLKDRRFNSLIIAPSSAVTAPFIHICRERESAGMSLFF